MKRKYRNLIVVLFVLLAACITICFIPISVKSFIPTVEQKVSEDLGINIRLDKLILRLGPSLKLKTPVMHMMYEDGQKFGQFDNVRIFIPWTSLLKKDADIRKIYANNLILKINSNDKYMKNILEKISSKEFNENPNVALKNYSLSYRDAETNKIYKLCGNKFSANKLNSVKNFKISSNGDFYINDNKYINYDINLLPKFDIHDNFKTSFDIMNFINQIDKLNVHSDIILDLKLYKNNNNEIKISGLTNIDNISIMDSDKKIPKSFVYLTFLGNKVGIFSNIYTSNDKKICLDGMINDSPKHELDLKIKTDEISLADLYNKFKFMTDCTKYSIIEDVDGKMIADFSIKGDINKIKSSGYLKLSEGLIKANGININKINSDIDFSNNVITILNTTGYVKDSPIMLKGKIDKTLNLELIMSKVELKHLLPSNYGIENGIVSLAANIGGTFENIIHKENLQIDNLKARKDGNTLNFGSLKINTNKENTAYINNLTIKPKFSETITIPALKLNIDNDLIKITDTNVFMPNSKLKLKADISNYNTNNLAYNANLSGTVNAKDIYSLKSYQANYPLKFNFAGNKTSQTVDAQVQLEKAMFLDEPALINLSAKLENDTIKIDDLSVFDFNGLFSDNLKSNIKGQKKIVISGLIENPKEPVFKNLRLFIPQQLNVSSMDTNAQLKGDIFINGNYKKPEIVGQFLIQNLINQALQLSVNNMTIDFNKNIAVVNAPVIKLADSSFAITSNIENDISKEVIFKTLNIKSKYVNTDTILMYKDNSAFKSVPYRVNEGKFYADKASVSVYGSQLLMTGLSADFKISDNIINAKNIASEMFNGKLASSLTFNLKDDSFSGKFQGRGVSASPIFEIISPKNDSVSGVLDFDTDLNGNIVNKHSLNGHVKFIVHNGRMGTLGKLEHLLYAQNIIADKMLRTSLSVVTKALTLKDTGLFKYLRGDLTLKDGVANIHFLQSQGPQMSLFIKGQYNTVTDYAKLFVLGRISDEVVSGLGAFGEFSLKKLMIMLTGNEDKFVVQPEDLSKLPQLSMKNTKEFRAIINGILEKPSSVLTFNWISYSQKTYKQKDVPGDNTPLPEFLNSLPY